MERFYTCKTALECFGFLDINVIFHNVIILPGARFGKDFCLKLK